MEATEENLNLHGKKEASYVSFKRPNRFLPVDVGNVAHS